MAFRIALAGTLLLLAAPGLAQTVYRHVDENGVVSFSDVATEGAESLTLAVSEPPEDALSNQQALIEQQLSVAKALEESRLAREDARTRRIEAQESAGRNDDAGTRLFRALDQLRILGQNAAIQHQVVLQTDAHIAARQHACGHKRHLFAAQAEARPGPVRRHVVDHRHKGIEVIRRAPGHTHAQLHQRVRRQNTIANQLFCIP